MLRKFVIFCIIYTIRITSKAVIIPTNLGPGVEIRESELKALNASRDELAALKISYDLDKQTWKNETKKLQDENKKLRDELLDLEEESKFQMKRVWALMWFRWLSMIKNEIEWRETVLTNFTYDETLFEEEKAKNKLWTKPEEYRRQVWNQILENCTDNPHIVSLLHEVDKTGIEISVFSKNIAFAYKELTAKLLSMMRWRNLPNFEKEPTFNTPITWSSEVNKCLLTLMFDVDKNMVWDFQTELTIEQATDPPPKKTT